MIGVCGVLPTEVIDMSNILIVLRTIWLIFDGPFEELGWTSTDGFANPARG